MENKEKVVCLYVMIDEDKLVDIQVMVDAMHQLAQESGLAFNNYAVSVEDMD